MNDRNDRRRRLTDRRATRGPAPGAPGCETNRPHADDPATPAPGDQPVRVRALVAQLVDVLGVTPMHGMSVISGEQVVAEAVGELTRSATKEVRMCLRTDDLYSEHVAVTPAVRWLVLAQPESVGAAHTLVSAATQAHRPEIRLVPHIPLETVVVDRCRAVLLHRASHRAIAIRSPSPLLGMATNCFDAMWETGRSLLASDLNGEPVDGGLDDEESILLAMMAAGSSDTAIGQALSMSKRTVQRRIGGVMQRLGAASRFQAGVRATTLGWI